MHEYDRIQQLKDALEFLSHKLQEEADKRRQTHEALKAIFPIELYKSLRHDLESTIPDDEDIINHYIEYGANEVDMKGEITKHSWFSAEQIANHILTDCRPNFRRNKNDEISTEKNAGT